LKTSELRAVLLIALALAASGTAGLGCGSRPSASGFYHEVAAGENLYRIGLRYGVSSEVLVKANRIDDVHGVRAGTRLWIPSGARGARPSGEPALRSEARRLARLEAERASKLTFGWPVQGRLTSRFGYRGKRAHEGIDLAARPGTSIRAAESGRVIHSGRLGDYGQVVILKHAGHYRSVYAHASKTLVRKGEFVEKGQRIALVGTSGRVTGPHLHFEIRRQESARDPMLYLP
jgi:murein DD-endopeptidase MepM/ murein hydrolase activator NlpD